MSKKELVVLKGCAEGVNMIINGDNSINEIMDAIINKIKNAGGFFKGECKVFVSGRELSRSDELRITSVMKTVFPEADIIYKKEMPKPEPEEEPAAKNHTDKGARFMEELAKAAELSRDFLRSGRDSLKPHKIDVRLFNGNVENGEVLNVRGDILVAGNVKKGGTVKADGNIYIIGRLEGKAFAGFDGDESCGVTASVFCPEAVGIGDVVTEFDEIAQENVPKMAYLMKRTIFIKEIL